MTVDGRMLLKMLEPVVRPGQTGGPSRPPVAPLEQQSFESLLGGIQADSGQRTLLAGLDGDQADSGGVPEAQVTMGKPTAVDPLRDLARVDQIQNASLRSLIANAGKVDSEA